MKKLPCAVSSEPLPMSPSYPEPFTRPIYLNWLSPALWGTARKKSSGPHYRHYYNYFLYLTMWNEAKWACWFTSFSPNHPGTRVALGTALISTLMFSQSERTTFFGHRLLFGFVSLKVGPLPLPWGRRVSAMWCGCVFGHCSRGIWVFVSLFSQSHLHYY